MSKTRKLKTVRNVSAIIKIIRTFKSKLLNGQQSRETLKDAINCRTQRRCNEQIPEQSFYK